MGCDFICQGAALNVVLFGFAFISFTLYAIRRRNGRRLVAGLAGGVCFAVAVVYFLNLAGILPTPLPVVIGRNLLASVGVVLALISFFIWKW